MPSVFTKLVENSKRISKDEYSINFGGVTEDVAEMLSSEQLGSATREAREIIENLKTMSDFGFGDEYSHIPRLQQVEFGMFNHAEELEKGEVAAIDGTNTLPIQLYTLGQALCVGIGSISHTRPMQDSLHYWSSKSELESIKLEDVDKMLSQSEQNIFGISQTAYLRYFEALHALEIKEKYIFFDGTLLYEWLLSQKEGINLYQSLFGTDKKYIGIMKNLKANPVFSIYSKALKQGEVFIVGTLKQHLETSNAPNKNVGESRFATMFDKDFIDNYTAKILRGVYKPRKKAFGFEVHIDHYEDMIRIMAADTQLNYVGHEIPFLLNRIDEEVRRTLNQRILKDAISARMAKESDELFIQETNERDFR